jgi:ACS family pantothenate transporter-like MFS transporter
MNKVKPSYLLSTFEITWGILVALGAIPKTPQELQPLHFFIGFLKLRVGLVPLSR